MPQLPPYEKGEIWAEDTVTTTFLSLFFSPTVPAGIAVVMKTAIAVVIAKDVMCLSWWFAQSPSALVETWYSKYDYYFFFPGDGTKFERPGGYTAGWRHRVYPQQGALQICTPKSNATGVASQLESKGNQGPCCRAWSAPNRGGHCFAGSVWRPFHRKGALLRRQRAWDCFKTITHRSSAGAVWE